MTGAVRAIGSALRALLKFFVDDGLYAAVTIAWITAVITFGSHAARNHGREGLILALGLDLIFIASIVLQVRSGKN